MDHGRCAIKQNPGWEEHTCPPCPHGFEKGGTFTPTGNRQLDDLQRDLKLRAIDAVTCDEHATGA